MKRFALLAVFLASCAVLHAAEGPKPNILFLIADDLATRVGCYGDKAAITPNIDRLASEAVVFQHAYVQGAVCTPSRTSFMLGLNNRHAKANHFIDHPETMTMGRWFREHGYQTCAIGKIDHDDPNERYVDPKAWDVRVKREDMAPTVRLQRRSLDEDLGAKRKNISIIGVSETPDAIGDSLRTDRAITFFEKERDASKPFFAAIGFHAPHVPWDAMRADFEKHDPARFSIKSTPSDVSPLPAGSLLFEPGIDMSEARQREGLQGYYAAVTFLDQQIGRLLEYLRAKGLLENTLVVLTSDHGYHLGWRGQWCKHTITEQVVRVPLIVRHPKAAKGAFAEGIVELLDLLPTFCDYAGLPAPSPLDGKSFVPLLKDPRTKGKAGAFCQFGNGRTVRSLQWRLIERNDGSDELYDHRNDPDEFRNVSSRPENAEVLKQLHAMLESELGPRPAPKSSPSFPAFRKKQAEQAAQ
ncbi:MAG: Choline-sulfatase [Verrucomicrobiota bacterium]|jgi:arylsulfatase A-like enzyme